MRVCSLFLFGFVVLCRFVLSVLVVCYPVLSRVVLSFFVVSCLVLSFNPSPNRNPLTRNRPTPFAQPRFPLARPMLWLTPPSTHASFPQFYCCVLLASLSSFIRTRKRESNESEEIEQVSPKKIDLTPMFRECFKLLLPLSQFVL